MTEKIRFRTILDPADCEHKEGHVCEHGLIDHCRFGPIFCGYCGTNLTELMERDLQKDLMRIGANTRDK